MAKPNTPANKPAENKEEKIAKNIVLVKFLRAYTPYIKGEVAGFDKKYAEKLIDAEIGEEFKK